MILGDLGYKGPDFLGAVASHCSPSLHIGDARWLHDADSSRGAPLLCVVVTYKALAYLERRGAKIGFYGAIIEASETAANHFETGPIFKPRCSMDFVRM